MRHTGGELSISYKVSIGCAMNSRRRADVPLWFIAVFEDGKATPDFLAGYEVGLSVALEAAGVEKA